MICGICRKTIRKGQKVQRDHIIPLSMGGLDIEDNIRLVHRKCNLKKSDKSPRRQSMVQPEDGPGEALKRVKMTDKGHARHPERRRKKLGGRKKS